MECHRYTFLPLPDICKIYNQVNWKASLRTSFVSRSHLHWGSFEAEAHLSLPRNFADREICRGEEVKRRVGAKTGLDKARDCLFEECKLSLP